MQQTPSTADIALAVANTVQERGSTHGDYEEQARVTQAIKRAMQHAPNAGTLPAVIQDALDMIAVKLGRILAGDATFRDHWHDIQGYARLVEERLPE